MQLNPSKFKLMWVDFLRYNSCYSWPIAVGGSVIELVELFKLLAMCISMDLRWSTHYNYIIKKSNLRLYALRKLKLCGVQDGELVVEYCSILRSASVCISSFCKPTTVSLHDSRKGAKESPKYHLWSWLELQGCPRTCRATVSRDQMSSGVQEICDGNYVRKPALPPNL